MNIDELTNYDKMRDKPRPLGLGVVSKMANICPYYKNGFCTSPALDKPTDAVVSTSRCFGQFKTCKYFLDNGPKVGLEIYNEDKTIEQKIRFYPKINVLESPIDSGCENYQLVKSEKGLIAYCRVLERVLVPQQATLCNKEFLKCPFRNFENK